MDPFYERLLARTFTIDELLSDDFEKMPGEKRDADLAARRLAAWCRSSASGDWSLFTRRLTRDGLSIEHVLTKFATVRRKPATPRPVWLDDAIWIERALHSSSQSGNPTAVLDQTQPCAFEHLFTDLLQKAEQELWSNIDIAALNNLTEAARGCLTLSLLRKVSDLCTPAIYERFCEYRKSATESLRPEPPTSAGTLLYYQYVTEMTGGGFRRLFEEKPVLLRLLASTVRQWIDTSHEFILRLHEDLRTIRSDIFDTRFDCSVVKIEDDLSDPHNDGRSVLLLVFADGARILYKPKDLRLDRAWQSLIARLNHASPPVELKAARTIARDGYGWVEFIAHAGCSRPEECTLFFRRSGAWLGLLHCFAATDMHQENLIATADHPVPIDVEMILQPGVAEAGSNDPETEAFEAAIEILANSVMAVGIVPSYARAVDHKVFAMGGLSPGWNSKIVVRWHDINSDEMKPFKSTEDGKTNPNLPYVADRYATFGDHIDEFVRGFQEYSTFLMHLVRNGKERELFEEFADLPVRKVIRPTRFYYMLLQRLKDHRSMDDGVIWSAQVDFIARLTDWESVTDPLWPLQRAERRAILSLNVPYFIFDSRRMTIDDATGESITVVGESGLSRARARVDALDKDEIDWQIEVIKENSKTNATSAETKPRMRLETFFRSDVSLSSMEKNFAAEADEIAIELVRRAVRRGPSAAWIGLDWLGDAEVFQLTCLGPTLYNGTSGIALFLAAHATVRGSGASHELALAGVSHLRKNLKSRNAARMARSLGIGGAAGLGSIVYALTEISKRLVDRDLLADALIAADLITDELIAADKQLDVIGGSAGAILALLRLYRDTGSDKVLKRAQKCGEHLLAVAQATAGSGPSWVGQGLGSQRLTGISHGAAGYALALASLFATTDREEFQEAAFDCLAFEDESYDPQHHNWPDFRRGQPSWPCQWCHGAVGIGLARLGSYKRGGVATGRLLQDIRRAVEGAKRLSPSPLDTLCCGSLGSVEFFCEAASTLGCCDLGQLASQRLQAVVEMRRHTGDYRWNSGPKKFNLGLFRGIAGVGYTLLRQVNGSLPNVLIWD